MPITTRVFASGEVRVMKEMPLVTSALLAMSQGLVNLAIPTGSN